MKIINTIKLAAFLGLSLSVLGTSNSAFADFNIYSPYISKGKVKLQSRTEYSVDDDDKVDGSFEQYLEAGYGVTDHWYLEAGVALKDKPSKDLETDNLMLQSKFELGEKGQYFVDAGFKVVYKHNTTGDADTLKAQLLLAKDIGKFKGLVNLDVEDEVGEDSKDRQKFKAAMRAQYMHSPYFQPSIEYFANFKDTTYDFEGQEHMAGPVVFGKITDSLKYEAGSLFGVSDKAPDAVLKLNFVYKFKI